jgi:hypothetical protein
MTWGQLRLSLGISAPGFSTDLIDEYITSRYGRILDHYPWKGLELETLFQSIAAYSTGTVSLTQGSNAVVGSGTTFTAGMTGLKFRVMTDAAVYIFTFTDATHGTLDRNYEGATNAAATFWIYQDQYVMPADLKTVLSVEDPVSGEPLDDWSKKESIELAYPPSNPGCPIAWTMAADTSEQTPPVLHTLQLIPAPLAAAGYPLRYQKAALGFSGENTAGGPLPWIDQKTLLDGVRADMFLQLKDHRSAETYEAKFTADLVEMVRLDGVRRKKPLIRMPAGSVGYRLRRVSR